MYSRLRRFVCVGALTAVIALAALPAHASFLLQDTYYGGLDTWHYPSDVIGDPNTFDISSAVIQRTNGGNTLEITINTNYAGKPGTIAADGTGYGYLFITPGKNVWNPTGTGPHYANDQYQAGEWTYAATIPQDPSRTSGNGALYLTSDGTVVTSHVGGCTQTYPNDPNCRFYFRQNQAVGFTPGIGQSPVAGTSESWLIGNGTITFAIIDNGLLTDDFALAWAMTCANDVIQGQVSVPEPSTWSLLLAGILFMGTIGVRRRRRAPEQA